MKSATRFKVTSTVWKNTANRFPDPSRKRSSKSLYESASPSAVARRLCVPAPVAAPLPHTAAASRPTRLTGASVLSPRRHKGLPRTLSGLRLHSRSVPQSCSRTLHGCVPGPSPRRRKACGYIPDPSPNPVAAPFTGASASP